MHIKGSLIQKQALVIPLSTFPINPEIIPESVNRCINISPYELGALEETAGSVSFSSDRHSQSAVDTVAYPNTDMTAWSHRSPLGIGHLFFLTSVSAAVTLLLCS